MNSENMKSCIFAENSGTTKEDINIPFKEFYQGGFRIVVSLAEELEEFGPTEVNILSDQFGVVHGEELVKNSDGTSDLEENAVSRLLESAESADVMVILLSSSIFDTIVVENWEKIIKNAKQNSILCLGASRSSLEKLDLEQLESKGCEIITYERVGVARIDNESRNELLDTIKNRM